MKQIVDKLNKIAKKINENVELSDRDLIIDSLDSITKAYGGTPNDSTLIVDKLDDIYNNIGSGGGGGGDIPYFTATIVNNSGVEIYSQTLNKYLPYGFLVGDGIYIEASETLTENFMYNGVEVDNNIIYFINPALGNDLSQVNTSYSNLVNCTVNVDNNRLMITNPSQNASATMTVTGLS